MSIDKKERLIRIDYTVYMINKTNYKKISLIELSNFLSENLYASDLEI